MKTALTLSISLLAVVAPVSGEALVSKAQAAPAAPLASPQSQAPTSPPAGDGLAILNRSCTSCHDSSQVTQARPAADWQPIVNRMRDNGANISDADAKTLVAYLIKNYSSGH
jgi:cytochrome c5